jgi:histidine triad (HIT) family protein
MVDTLFTRIINREIPAEIVHEDAQCIAIKDVNPQAPLHVLVIPRQPIDMLSNASPADAPLLGHLMLTACRVARQLGHGDAFRVVVNNGAAAGQSVFHLHVHLLAGRGFKWPPG